MHLKVLHREELIDIGDWGVSTLVTELEGQVEVAVGEIVVSDVPEQVLHVSRLCNHKFLVVDDIGNHEPEVGA